MEIFFFIMIIVLGVAGTFFQLVPKLGDLNTKALAKYCFIVSVCFLLVTLIISLG